MKALIAIAWLLTLLGGCSKSVTITSITYSGNFNLTSPIDIPLNSQLRLTFTGVNFSGSGDSSVLPYIGGGVFKLKGDSIYFTQTGAVPDFFERGSILEGSFLLEQNADSLVFSRRDAAGTVGQEVIYRLRRE